MASCVTPKSSCLASDCATDLPETFHADCSAVESLRGAKILAAIEFGLVAIADKARPELGAFVTRVHISREPHHVPKAPHLRRESGFGHVGGKIEAAVDARVAHTKSADQGSNLVRYRQILRYACDSENRTAGGRFAASRLTHD